MSRWGVQIHTGLNSKEETEKIFNKIKDDFYRAEWNSDMYDEDYSDWFEFERVRSNFICLEMVSESYCYVEGLEEICKKYNCTVSDYED
ncbi:hypothetical protein EJM73_09120 [Clostridium botulinum]|uniref:hypothetical protein n=1 Tax=Clostridium botulinum TaxID=1491 RepID=UPI0013761749|nr:hypothetical protein [Clostridium botulinum]NCI19786.1 hypothetical protein [Clostridium botulinum]NCI35824.1 hypothetical protein [Clostridium botulinum]NCI71681.1 hypothetical protein [Clostridium botulinum]NDI38873.1 hypothetical protein [Clostridium botulinum]HCL4447262.1 hypothetical protein [Clostridium botulinum]